jgi:UDP-N-acetylmuramate--alanine ligase
VKQSGDILYFLGIGGIGMSALARYYHRRGFAIYGYDLTPTPLTQNLEREGMHIHYEEDVQRIPEGVQRVVYTPAIPADHKELQYFKAQGFDLVKRAQVLGELSHELFTIAIAGSHGKTSVTAMVAHLLKSARLPVVAFIGGISKDINGNFLDSASPEYLVVEADEFDRSLMQLQPNVAVVTSMDADHLDIYESAEKLESVYQDFVRKLGKEGKLISQEKLTQLNHEGLQQTTYGLSDKAKVRAAHVEIVNGKIGFDVYRDQEKLTRIVMQIPGMLYVENALAALSVGLELGIDVDVIRQAMESFTGVQRRFDIRIKKNDCVYIDDYAHHPEELKATIKAVRMLYPDKKLTVVFQPHLYSRTRDFVDGFAEALSRADEVFLLDIYPAREMPIPGVTSKLIFDKIKLAEKHLFSKSEFLAYLRSYKPEVFLSMGAGDIGLMVKDIEHILCL